MKKVLLPALALASLVLATTAAAVPTPHAGAPDRERVLVGFDRAPSASDRAAVARLGAVVRHVLPDANALALDVSGSSVGALARLGGVSYVERDELRYPLGLADAQLTPSLDNGLYGLLTTKATTVHSRVTGAGVKACVADTGLDQDHPDIAPNYKGGIDTVANPTDYDPSHVNPGLEVETHGTHVAGTVLAANNGVGVLGVAYGAELYHARVLTNDGGYSSDIMDGVRWLVATKGCKVVNMSLGGGFKSKTEENFYKSMRNNYGALIVAASGNDGAKTVSFPAGYASNIAVGAVDRNNAHASFSNTGRNIDISAPGVTVLSAVPDGHGSESSVTADATHVAYGLEFAGKTEGTTGTLVDCGLAQAAGDCGATPPADFVALIQRGGNSFAEKVENAAAAGADAVVIYNNVAGDFTGTLGAEGDWIPAVSVSDTVGATLKTRRGTQATVANWVSSWDHYDGTSMATPHVTGVVALIWSANPALSNSTVENYLFTSATNLGPAGYDTTYGHGLVNADEAVAKTGK